MRRETHRAALRMASKVAFPLSILACGSTPSPPITATPATETKPTTTAAPEKLSCERVIDEAFPTEGKYPGTKQNVSPEAVACCREVLLQHMGGAPHRWDCCANVEKDSNHLHAACTPWGPPTPPAMAGVPSLGSDGVVDLRERARAIAVHVPRDAELEAAALATWRGRMVNEYASSRVFAALAQQLEDAGLDAREVAGFAAEEQRHGVLCGAVVEALGGDALGELPAAPEFPLHPDAGSKLEAALRNALSVCCLSETVAVALIGAERIEMPESELRNLLTTIWSDEVGHARFGWRLLSAVSSSLDEATRDRLGDYLEVAFEHLVEHELAHLPISSNPPDEGAAYGLCNGRDARELFFDTVATVIVPALESQGLPAARAWARANAA